MRLPVAEAQTMIWLVVIPIAFSAGYVIGLVRGALHERRAWTSEP